MRDNKPRVAFKLNVMGLDNVLEASRLTNVGRIVYCSSIAVHGGVVISKEGEKTAPPDRVIMEDETPAPRKQYDHHKVFNEWQAREYREKHGMSVIGIRPTNVGGSDKLAVGSTEHVRAVVFPALGQPVELDYPDRMRCCIHGDDAAEAFRLVALAKAPKHTIYTTGGDPLSIGEVADMVRSHIPDADIRFTHASGGKAFSGAYRFSNQRLTEEFGFTYKPWAEVVPMMIENVRRRAKGG
jgi:nucleoside-diphosphate-sugar epimerase